MPQLPLRTIVVLPLIMAPGWTQSRTAQETAVTPRQALSTLMDKVQEVARQRRSAAQQSRIDAIQTDVRWLMNRAAEGWRTTGPFDEFARGVADDAALLDD